MKQPDELRTVTEKVLGGLNADESLKFRILQKAAETPQSRKNRFAFLPALYSVIAVMLIAIVALNSIKPVDTSLPVEINSFAAGNQIAASLQNGQPVPELSAVVNNLSPDNISSVEMRNSGIILDPQQCSKLFRILVDSSVRSSDVMTSFSDLLIITASDGAQLEFKVDEPYLLCGGSVWLCPDFFEQFHSLLK